MEVGPARRYVAAVYQDPRAFSMPVTELHLTLSKLWWIYHSGQSLFRIRCMMEFSAYCPSLLTETESEGRTHIALLHKAPNLIHRISLYGFWLHSRLPSALRPDDATTHSTGTGTGGWTRDHGWAEVLRLSPTWTMGEGGTFGYWFEAAPGSGIALDVGRSLRAYNRSHLATLLGLNVTRIFAKPVHGDTHLWMQSKYRANTSAWFADEQAQRLYPSIPMDDEVGLRRRYFDNYPWRLEAKVDLCAPAIALGYQTLQIWHEACSLLRTQTACGIEVVSCHAGGMRLKSRSHHATCVPGLPLRTGLNHSLPCGCNDTLDLLNCADTRGSGLPVPPMLERAPPATTVRKASLMGGHSWHDSWMGALREWPRAMRLCDHGALRSLCGGGGGGLVPPAQIRRP